jgi:peptidoglycan/LPS O-acetylase OafA/YrhL
MRPMTHPLYRPDVDGLRAIAVLSVVGFHAFPEFVPGGFVGVDIFFVISGFLISSILLSNLEHDRFSLVAFYGRRIKRIFPALVLVLTSVLAIGWFLLVADEYRELGKHVFGGSAFLSNLILWQESGYFDSAAETKPLLHLWSLAIEEQFYIFWPLLLFGLWKTGNRRFLSVIAAVAVGSFLVNVVTVDRSQSTAFYLPFSRVWELMIGGLLASVAQHRSKHNILRTNLRSLLGFVLLALALALLDRRRAFPGWWALLPTLGAALVIASGQDALLSRWLLSNRLVVWIGLISYPLYLWHWVLLSFARIVAGQTPDVATRSAAVMISIAMATLTYVLVERPIRFGTNSRSKVTALVALMIAAGGFGFSCYWSDGVPTRAVARLNPGLSTGWDGGERGLTVKTCGLLDDGDRKFIKYCVQDARQPPTYALLGDSKAQALFAGLARTSEEGGRWVMLAGNGTDGATEPLLSDNPLYRNHQTALEVALKTINANEDIRVVVFASATRVLFQLANDFSVEDLPESTNYDVALEGMDRAVKEIVSHGRKIVFVVDNPTLPDPRDCVTRNSGNAFLDRLLPAKSIDGCHVSLDRHLRLTSKYRDLLRAIQGKYPADVMLFDTTPYMCSAIDDVCASYRDGHFMYGHTDHVSDYAAGLIGKGLNSALATHSTARP